MAGVSTGPTGYRSDSLIEVSAVYPPISSPSPTPSLVVGASSSQVDDLFPPSPLAKPGDGVPILELDSFRMGKSSPSDSFTIIMELGQEKSTYRGRTGLAIPMKVCCNVPRGIGCRVLRESISLHHLAQTFFPSSTAPHFVG